MSARSRAAFASALLAGAVAAQPTQVTISMAGSPPGSSGAVVATLAAAPLAAPGTAEGAREWEVRAPATTEIELVPETGWRLSVRAPGYWASDLLLPPGERSPVSLRLLPAGTIGGRIVVGQQGARPGALQVRFQSPPKPGVAAVPVTTISCPVREERWHCDVPAGILDLRLQAEGFIPRYLWDVQVRAGVRRDLGRFDLVPGASVIGWLQIEGAVAPGRAPEIGLRPHFLARPGAFQARERMSQTALATWPTERGFFQFQGVPAGEYVVSARLEGFAPAESDPLTVLIAGESELREPVVLYPPLSLEVHLHPPLDPYGQPWQVELLEGDVHPPVMRLESRGGGPADLHGFWRLDGLPAASYLLTVKDFAGSALRNETIEVTPGLPPLELALDVIALEGEITRGDEPLETTLWFVRDAQRIRFESDEEGAFSGYLPAEGAWRVDLASPDRGEQTLEPVEVQRPPQAKAARVAIRVPNTRLAIRVVEEKGTPVGDAEVFVFSGPETRRREAQVLTDEKGEATVHGIAPGFVQLFASGGQGASEWVIHHVSEDAEAPAVELTLRPRIRLNGRVLGPQGPVAGAVLTVIPDVLSGRNVWYRRGVSEADGRFQVLLDRPFPGGSLAVFPPGFALQLRRLPAIATSEEELVIQVNQDGGDVLVELDEGEDLFRQGPYLSRGGARLPLTGALAEDWGSRRPGGLLALPALEPGTYVFCPDRESPPADCVSGFLPPQGELRLRCSPGGARDAPAEKRQPAGAEPGGDP